MFLLFLSICTIHFFITVYLFLNVCIGLKEERNNKVSRFQCVQWFPNLKFRNSGSKHLYFPHLKQSRMFHFLYNFQLAIHDSHKHWWWRSLVKQLTVWHKDFILDVCESLGYATILHYKNLFWNLHLINEKTCIN